MVKAIKEMLIAAEHGDLDCLLDYAEEGKRLDECNEVVADSNTPCSWPQGIVSPTHKLRRIIYLQSIHLSGLGQRNMNSQAFEPLRAEHCAFAGPEIERL